MSDKVLGIIGGMGPEATVDLMTKIIRATPAKIEQEHIRVLVDNNPHIPPRVEAIMGDGENPGPVMAEMARNLEKGGADFLVIACNTAHYWYSDAQNAVEIPVLNMIEEAVKVLKKDSFKNVMLFATLATIHTKLYEKALNEAGINLLLPDQPHQEKVLKAIKDVKFGNFIEARSVTKELVQHALDQGAEALILGCTELPFAFNNPQDFPIAFYDPAEIIAKIIVDKAYTPKI
ncbi:MAG: aspartate/glutamate racemase family protein [Peptococcales bacterium]|jgi:aspartate racemase